MSPIAATDIHFRLSGGAANASQNASLGGAKSTTTDASASLFDDDNASQTVDLDDDVDSGVDFGSDFGGDNA